jgi:hypothetical protein
MPLLILAEILFQGFCIYHCTQTGRTQPWLYIIMLVPGIGPAAYVLFEIFPDMANTRRGRRVFTDVRTILDPDREYRERQAEVELSGTPAAKVALAEECARKGMNDDAIRLYRSALTGIHADDPAMLLGLARMQIGGCDYSGCQQTLDLLREKNPTFDSADGHLIYARALEGQNKITEATIEYEALVGYYPGYEAKSRYGLFQQKLGNIEKARSIFEGVVKSYKQLPRHAQQLNREWYEVARRNVE